MKILIRNHRNEKWQKVRSAAYTNEAELQRLLAEDPALIAGEEVNSQAGELLARVGSSGASSEPHLHIHAQAIEGGNAAGSLPITFCGRFLTRNMVFRVPGD